MKKAHSGSDLIGLVDQQSTIEATRNSSKRLASKYTSNIIERRHSRNL